ncbi:MAG: transglutaminase-like domain-containing protein [Paramuribaculum sp.]|nr:transglutaminase-like domain-containing protein [Paramuribaculum sp.]
MKIRYSFILLATAFALNANAGIADEAVKADFKARSAQLTDSHLLEVFSRPLTSDQRDALEVLYAYMPLPDITDHDADFYLSNVNASLQARKEMPWGSTVPDREFRHFVLPVRVNNETVDLHRPVFYNELKERVKNLSMRDAILEINHWCHEKATYQPSDGRTHAPLATVYTAIGRCGEESTFTVAALRAMGIPARQVYTPRWAHTDDNHAWVEAWADGTWYFLGACEPEPVLNLAWFNAPASRGMLMNSRVYGRYDGPEEKLMQRLNYTDINVTSIYTPVDTTHVTVFNPDGTPASDAQVTFRLYNYGEFYPIAGKNTDKHGHAELITGLGDMLVWAEKDGMYGFTKTSVGKDNKVIVKLKQTQTDRTIELDMVPPVPGNNLTPVTDDQVTANQLRLAYEDSIRGAYAATFATPDQAETLAEELNVNTDDIKQIMSKARANHIVLTKFLRQTPSHDRKRAISLIKSLSTKDISDVSAEVLADCMTSPIYPTELYSEYILSPRIDTEELTPFRKYFNAHFNIASQNEFRTNPLSWVKWVADSIDGTAEWYPANARMSPVSVLSHRHTAPISRNIFFVAGARSMGIPARIDPVTNKPQWADSKGNWINADFVAPLKSANKAKGKLQLTFSTTGRIDDPKYYIQFTLSKIENGHDQLLNYPDDGTWSTLFKEPTEVDAGDYMLVTGQRMANGSVLTRMDFFNVAPDSLTVRPLVIRQDSTDVQVIGSFDAEILYHDTKTDSDKSVLSTTGRGYYVLGILKPNHEPTNHALRDIAAVAQELEKWNRSIILLYPDAQQLQRADTSLMQALPSTVVSGTDINGNITKAITEAMKLPNTDLPIFIIADTFNRVVFVSQGYTIGLGDTLIDTIHKLQ